MRIIDIIFVAFVVVVLTSAVFVTVKETQAIKAMCAKHYPLEQDACFWGKRYIVVE